MGFGHNCFSPAQSAALAQPKWAAVRAFSNRQSAGLSPSPFVFIRFSEEAEGGKSEVLAIGCLENVLVLCKESYLGQDECKVLWNYNVTGTYSNNLYKCFTNLFITYYNNYSQI